MAEKDLVLGIDIGGTNTAFGFVDRQGVVALCDTMPTMAGDPAHAFAARLTGRIEEAKSRLPFPHRLLGVGVGAPNAHHDRGTIERAPHLNWGDSVNLTGMMRLCFHLPAAVTNDANAAALGEMLFGGARGMKHFMVVTLGTGLGSGIVVDGRLLYGASGFAGELGHTVVDPGGRPCGCGKRGCLETYASAPGLVRTAMELLERLCDPSPLRNMADGNVTSEIICEAARKGEAVSLAAFDSTARILGMKLADAVAHTSPEAIFLAGGVAKAGALLLEPAQRYLNDFLFDVYRGTVTLKLSELPDGTSAILGAAALIWSELSS